MTIAVALRHADAARRPMASSYMVEMAVRSAIEFDSNCGGEPFVRRVL